MKEWLATGIGLGVEVFAAGFTFLMLAGVVLGIIGAVHKLVEELHDESDKPIL